jgi:hypothetical protein
MVCLRTLLTNLVRLRGYTVACCCLYVGETMRVCFWKLTQGTLFAYWNAKWAFFCCCLCQRDYTGPFTCWEIFGSCGRTSKIEDQEAWTQTRPCTRKYEIEQKRFSHNCCLLLWWNKTDWKLSSTVLPAGGERAWCRACGEGDVWVNLLACEGTKPASSFRLTLVWWWGRLWDRGSAGGWSTKG